MTRALYNNRISWTRSFTPFQFNAGIQSTQSVESFNSIIKKALNSASTLCDVEKIINKRHEDESQYCKLIDLKDQYMTIGLSYILSQFFSSVDAISELETINDNFIEDVLDEPQATLQSLLSKTVTKGIICRHFWRVMLYSHFARFHISIIPTRWYKDNIHTKLDFNVKNSPVLSALESPFNIDHKHISQRNRYGIAFSIAKTAINIALENNKDAELHLIDQITSPNVTKIRGAPRKKRIKAVMEILKGNVFNEITNTVQEADHDETAMQVFVMQKARSLSEEMSID
ncbi:hypothetical protein C2G38_2212058 [Gigaspora rosea]|uniref:Uncharacterized protein n=1 Tax=Gigaspora rosea TaxID=44941 RepID=A0A397UDD1_9GLOM|nr:hypothetical protein C2G38_2212058 [Gigaspora rosea]